MFFTLDSLLQNVYRPAGRLMVLVTACSAIGISGSGRDGLTVHEQPPLMPQAVADLEDDGASAKGKTLADDTLQRAAAAARTVAGASQREDAGPLKSDAGSRAEGAGLAGATGGLALEGAGLAGATGGLALEGAGLAGAVGGLALEGAGLAGAAGGLTLEGAGPAGAAGGLTLEGTGPTGAAGEPAPAVRRQTETAGKLAPGDGQEAAAKEQLAAADSEQAKGAPEAGETIDARIPYDEQDYEVMLKIVQAEAGGCDSTGKILVANVIMNRVEDSSFPDDITSVVYERSQFTPVSSGAIDRVQVTKETVECVDRALQGEDPSQGALYFMNRKASGENAQWFDRKLTFLFSHDGHEFFK